MKQCRTDCVHIIDFESEMLKRFRVFAEEYLLMPETLETNPVLLIAILIDKKVFTLEEIRRELIQRKIVFPETVFKTALETVNRMHQTQSQDIQTD